MPHLVSYHVFIAPRVLGLELKHARVTVQKLSTLSGRQARPWLRLHREDVDENQTRESTVYMYKYVRTNTIDKLSESFGGTFATIGWQVK